MLLLAGEHALGTPEVSQALVLIALHTAFWCFTTLTSAFCSPCCFSSTVYSSLRNFAYASNVLRVAEVVYPSQKDRHTTPLQNLQLLEPRSKNFVLCIVICCIVSWVCNLYPK